MKITFTVLIFLMITSSSCQSGGNKTSQESDTTVVESKSTPAIDQGIDKTDKVEVTSKAASVNQLPDFSKYTDVKEKKKAFFDFLKPMVEEENSRLTADRKKLLSLYEKVKTEKELSKEDTLWLEEQALQFRVKNFDINKEASRLALQKKLDIVPSSLFLAQAANESAWGTSRFAREANNLFGQWCFTPGCGIVPSQRAKGETHEVQKFERVNDAVRSYVTNINRHNAYEDLRVLRYEQRIKGEKPTGVVCAGGLLNYSARREEYVKEIRAMIRVNNLEEI